LKIGYYLAELEAKI